VRNRNESGESEKRKERRTREVRSPTTEEAADESERFWSAVRPYKTGNDSKTIQVKPNAPLREGEVWIRRRLYNLGIFNRVRWHADRRAESIATRGEAKRYTLAYGVDSSCHVSFMISSSSVKSRSVTLCVSTTRLPAAAHLASPEFVFESSRSCMDVTADQNLSHFRLRPFFNVVGDPDSLWSAVPFFFSLFSGLICDSHLPRVFGDFFHRRRSSPGDNLR